MYLDYNAGDLAVFTLTFLAGMATVSFFASIPWRWGLRTVASGVIVVWLLVALASGHSELAESLTRNLADYIHREPLGFVGYLAGVAVGLANTWRGRRVE